MEEQICRICNKNIQIPLGLHIIQEHEEFVKMLNHIDLSSIEDKELRERTEHIGFII